MWVRGLKQEKDEFPHIQGSRTPCGCVDWNSVNWIVLILLLVAPHVGAWIETYVSTHLSSNNSSHPMWVRGLKLRDEWQADYKGSRTPSGCVDWNVTLLSASTEQMGRTPSGCVDWNALAAHSSTGVSVSHPEWVRGLKRKWKSEQKNRQDSRPPSGCVDWNYAMRETDIAEKLSHPEWVRGLKRGCVQWWRWGQKSHPMWVRGLKPTC